MSPEDAALRKKWMDAYIAAGGKYETIELSGKKPGDATEPCISGDDIPDECAYLKKPYTVEAPEADFDRIRGTATLSEGKPGTHTFPGDSEPSDATVYEVDVKGRKVEVIMPNAGAPEGKHLPTPEQVAQSLAAVPGPQLDSIQQVVVSPNQNPDDAYWAEEYDKPDFTSVATGGPGGVTFYPRKTPYGQEFVDSTMIHEGGHAYSGDLWEDEEKKKSWEKAMEKDPGSPSEYADSAPTEDFSESLVMYSLSKNTKCGEFAKKLYPNRYKVLDEMFTE
jgi:hypothetical protein